ncbi:protein IWS1 homolog isoform X2 [Xenia sp. Carnegie-2017]|uniref:protein IWS1 homolog isoform X2 n=1 Tax=Xenia sp. Carnegie-2017 TaxID=2897299 RepID=UPI001F0504BF|nr:protein IWS1 homolog isoform X2 [Xenia sp. Carnegie-2017]
MSDSDNEKSDSGSEYSEAETPPTPGNYVNEDSKRTIPKENQDEKIDEEEKLEEAILNEDNGQIPENDHKDTTCTVGLSDLSHDEIRDERSEDEMENKKVQIDLEQTAAKISDDEDNMQKSFASDNNDINDNVKDIQNDKCEGEEAPSIAKENQLDDDNQSLKDVIEPQSKMKKTIENTNSSSLDVTEDPKSLDLEIDEANTTKLQDHEKEEQVLKNDTLEENDLLNLTEISDFSMQLTGDEEAIVEDILQNAGDDILLPEGSKQGNVSHKTPKDDNDIEESTGVAGELINDIFGSSDEDDEDFQGFEDDELRGSTKMKKKSKTKPEKKDVMSDEEDDEKKQKPEEEIKAVEEPMTVPPPEDSDDDVLEESSQAFVSDFDLMMEKKREENRKARRRRKDCDIINDNDDFVANIIKTMKEAAEEDRLANEARQAATKKLKMLPTILRHMLKIDLMVIFVESNVLPVLKEWISPLPDGSLPHLQIREGILNILEQLPPVDSGTLKVSGIGKAVMYLFRHPKETRKNKQRAGKIISEWSRPIFGVTANFKSMSREEREERDYANMSKRRRLSRDGVDGGKTPKRIENAIKSDSKSLRPGDKGWCMRARVPAPSNKDYVVRPKSNIEPVDFSKTSKKTLNRFEKQKRKLNEKKAVSRQRAVDISLEGRKMAL